MENLSIGAKLAITMFFVLLNGFFVGAEFALVKLRPSRAKALAEQGDKRAKALCFILENLDLHLAGCQLGITISSLVLGWLAEPAVAELLLALVRAAGFSAEGALIHLVALAIALSIITLLHMTVGEQAPKIWALAKPELASLWAAHPLRFFVTFLRPLIWIINQVSNAMVRAGGVSDHGAHEAIYSSGELREILRASAGAGKISTGQERLADNVLALVHLQVRHILLPRIDVAFLSLKDSVDTNLEKIRKSGHSRFPVCEEGLDSVVGILHTRDLVSALLVGSVDDLRPLLREPVVVPDAQPLSKFLQQAQASKRHCAVVVDEHGTMIGLAFLEDALEEIVGPLHDEFDTDTMGVSDLGGGILEVDGSSPLPEVRRWVDAELRGDQDTIAGLLVARLGRMPDLGDCVRLADCVLEVSLMDQNRVARVKISPISTSSH